MSTRPLASPFRDAVASYDQAIAIRRRLVEEEGRVELADDLAAALMNKGVALASQGRLGDAVVSSDQAIGVLRRLVEEEGRVELANELAKAFVNKATTLGKQEAWDEAFANYEAAIFLNAGCLRAGMTHLLGDALKMIRIRLMTYLDLRRWEDGAADVFRILELAVPELQSGSPSESVVQELGQMLDLIRCLPDDGRASLLDALGPWAGVVRGWLSPAEEESGP